MTDNADKRRSVLQYVPSRTKEQLDGLASPATRVPMQPSKGHALYSRRLEDQRAIERFIPHYVDTLHRRRAYVAAFGEPTSDRAMVEWLRRVLTNPAVVAEIDKRCQQRAVLSEVTSDRITAELAKMAFVDVRSFYEQTAKHDPETGELLSNEWQLKPIGELDDDTAAAVVGIKETKTGLLIPEIADKRAALMDLAKLHGMIIDKSAIKIQAQINAHVVVESDDVSIDDLGVVDVVDMEGSPADDLDIDDAALLDGSDET